MYNNVAEIIYMDKHVDEFVTVRVGKHVFNCFVSGCSKPCETGKKYKTTFNFEYIKDDSGWIILTEYDDDPDDVESIKSKEDLFDTEAIGHVRNGIFYVGDLEIDFESELEHDYKASENQYVEVIADRVMAEFGEEVK